MSDQASSDRAAAPHWLVDMAVMSDIRSIELPEEPGPGELSRAWETLTAATKMSEADLANRVASHFKLDVADMESADARACKLVPVEVALAHGVFPLTATDSEIVVATADPQNRTAEEEVGEAAGRAVRFRVAPPNRIAESIARFYSPHQVVEDVVTNLSTGVETDGLQVVQEQGGEEALELEVPAVVQLTKLILDQLARDEVTEIHIEPHADGGRVHVRKDGELQRFMHLPSVALKRVVLRFRRLGGLGPSRDGAPERGFIRVTDSDGERDLLVAITPGLRGERLSILEEEPDFEDFVARMAAATDIARAAATQGPVLVVDDDVSTRLLMRAVLEKEGFEVIEAHDGPPALHHLEERSDVSLVVLDLNMPELNGREVLRTIRTTPSTAGLPVVVLTSIEDPAVEIQLLAAGADDYLRKPIDPERLVVRARAVLRRAGSYEPWPDTAWTPP